MATCRWIGAAQAISDVWTVQVTAYDAATSYRLTVGNKYVSVIAQGSVNLTASALVTAWNASSEPELAEATASSATDTVTLTAKTAGIPLTPVSSVSGGAGTIGAASNTTVATGPNYWSNTANWSTGAVPVSTDDVVLENSAVGILYGLAQSAVTLTSLTVRMSFAAQIGLPEVNTSSGTDYHEYRSRYLAISATTVTVGEGDGTGPTLINLNVGTVACTLNVRNAGSPLVTDTEVIQWKGTNAANVVNVSKGSVAIAGFGGDSATVATLRVSYVSSQTSDATVRCGSGTTLTTVTVNGGAVDLSSAVTTLTMNGGTVTCRGTMTGATVTINSGTLYWLSSGTITTASVGNNGTIDWSQDARTRTVTNVLNVYPGATLNDPLATVTFSAGFKLNGCRIAECTLDVGESRTITPS
jgi:hypothetical protein